MNKITSLPLGSQIEVQQFKGGISKYKPTDEYKTYTLSETHYSGVASPVQVWKPDRGASFENTVTELNNEFTHGGRHVLPIVRIKKRGK